MDGYDLRTDPACLGSLDADERAMLYDLLNAFGAKLYTERRLNADLSRKLEACQERISLLEATAYGLF